MATDDAILMRVRHTTVAALRLCRGCGGPVAVLGTSMDHARVSSLKCSVCDGAPGVLRRDQGHMASRRRAALTPQFARWQSCEHSKQPGGGQHPFPNLTMSPRSALRDGVNDAVEYDKPSRHTGQTPSRLWAKDAAEGQLCCTGRDNH